VSRAYRPADFEAFLRKHSDSSPSRQSEQADRAQMDRGSRASSHGDRQSRDQRDFNRDNSDRFRTTYRDRNREYSLRESEVKTLIELGKFRVVPADDLARQGYKGDRSRMENDVQHLRYQGLVEQRSIEGHESYSKQVFTLTKEGHKLLSEQNLIPDRQAIYHGFVKARKLVMIPTSTGSITKSPRKLTALVARFAVSSSTTNSSGNSTRNYLASLPTGT